MHIAVEQVIGDEAIERVTTVSSILKGVPSLSLPPIHGVVEFTSFLIEPLDVVNAVSVAEHGIRYDECRIA